MRRPLYTVTDAGLRVVGRPGSGYLVAPEIDAAHARKYNHPEGES